MTFAGTSLPVNKLHGSLGLSDKEVPVTAGPGEKILCEGLNTQHVNWW